MVSGSALLFNMVAPAGNVGDGTYYLAFGGDAEEEEEEGIGDDKKGYGANYCS